jgi:hypothetical protein
VRQPCSCKTFTKPAIGNNLLCLHVFHLLSFVMLSPFMTQKNPAHISHSETYTGFPLPSGYIPYKTRSAGLLTSPLFWLPSHVY